jgi:hypothetical protein
MMANFVIETSTDWIDGDPTEKETEAEAVKILGFISLYRDTYYREWSFKFTFDDNLISEADAKKQVNEIIRRTYMNYR